MLAMILLELNVEFPANAMAWVEQGLRWLHFLAGITWIGMLYFFNLVNVPLMKELDAGTKGRVIPKLLPRALWWFRWGAVWTVFAGVLYFMIYLMRDAKAYREGTGQTVSWLAWFGIWFGVWAVTWLVCYLLSKQASGPLNDGRILAVAVAIVIAVASWGTLELISHPAISAKSLSIAVGGGMGFFMLLNVWGVIWRIQKKIIAWTAENAEKGTAMPPEAAGMARLAFKVSRANAWLSIPMLFFMAAASHFPFLSGR